MRIRSIRSAISMSEIKTPEEKYMKGNGKMTGSVKIIQYNANAHSIVSAAGRISTTEGGADAIYDKSCANDAEKNIKLINKILSSGHESVLEHISVNLAFDNVSVYVEQFMIEFRLASFTVKSRRYVDFGKMGYVLPDFSEYMEADAVYMKDIYQRHMQYLFDEYNFFIEQGVPKEDARFVLPYSFRSNFFCTVNARELIKIMNEMVYGRGKNYPELVRLGQSLFEQCEKELPYLRITKPQTDLEEVLGDVLKGAVKKEPEASCNEELVTLVSGTEKPEEIICKAAALNYGVPDWMRFEADNAAQRQIIEGLLRGGRKRELEQVNFTILFNRISLAGVTHLVRHRMQSILIPKYIERCDFSEYVLPESVVKAGVQERYKEVFTNSQKAADVLKEKGFRFYDQVYLLLSGMTIPVMTTMNANELVTFIRLRTCNRAQWEIKECGDALLKILRAKYPILFSLYGPSCYMSGICPEGKMTCGHMKEVREAYSIAKEE